MKTITYITLLFAPVVAGFMLLYLRKKVSGSFFRLLIRSFLMGAIGSAIVVFALFLSSRLGLSTLTSLKRILFYCFITVGFGSELSKFILYYTFIFNNREIDRPIHAITASVMNAMGFATVFLVLFFFDLFSINQNFPVNTFCFTVVPANLIFSIILGFFLGMAKFLNSRLFFSVLGLTGATFFHGFFLFCEVTADFKLLSLFAFFSMLIVSVLLVKAMFTRPESTV